jgi:hypothetical protein
VPGGEEEVVVVAPPAPEVVLSMPRSWLRGQPGAARRSSRQPALRVMCSVVILAGRIDEVVSPRPWLPPWVG